MNTEKVYAKKTKYDWNMFVFFELVFSILVLGMVFSTDIGLRAIMGMVAFLVAMLLNAGLMVQTSEDKEVEIGYIKHGYYTERDAIRDAINDTKKKRSDK